MKPSQLISREEIDAAYDKLHLENEKMKAIIDAAVTEQEHINTFNPDWNSCALDIFEIKERDEWVAKAGTLALKRVKAVQAHKGVKGE